jgi:hypothetical protein
VLAAAAAAADAPGVLDSPEQWSMLADCFKHRRHCDANSVLAAAAAAAAADAPGVLDSPEQWSMLADCYVKAGRRHAAMAMYSARLQDMGLQDPRCALQNRVYSLLVITCVCY